MGIPLLQGRDFDDRDRVDGGDDPQPWTVAIVNRKFAEHFFGAQDPIGRRIGCCHGPGTKPSIRIVGVVENSLFAGPRAGVRRQVFLPYMESASPAAVTFYVRSARPAAAIFATLRRLLATLDRSVPVYDMETLENQLDETLSTDRLIAFLSTVFGVLATVLAALGLYGVMAFVVMRRTGELGLRMALGAPRSSVLWLIMRETLIRSAGRRGWFAAMAFEIIIALAGIHMLQRVAVIPRSTKPNTGVASAFAVSGLRLHFGGQAAAPETVSFAHCYSERCALSRGKLDTLLPSHICDAGRFIG